MLKRFSYIQSVNSCCYFYPVKGKANHLNRKIECMAGHVGVNGVNYGGQREMKGVRKGDNIKKSSVGGKKTALYFFCVKLGVRPGVSSTEKVCYGLWFSLSANISVELSIRRNRQNRPFRM